MKLIATFETGEANSAAETVGQNRGPALPKGDDVAPAARNLALAHRLGQMIDSGLIADYTAAARLLNVSQPRLTHLMGLLLLAPQIQEGILFGTVKLGDKQLRQLARIAGWPEQLAAISRL